MQKHAPPCQPLCWRCPGWSGLKPAPCYPAGAGAGPPRPASPPPADSAHLTPAHACPGSSSPSTCAPCSTRASAMCRGKVSTEAAGCQGLCVSAGRLACLSSVAADTVGSLALIADGSYRPAFTLMLWFQGPFRPSCLPLPWLRLQRAACIALETSPRPVSTMPHAAWGGRKAPCCCKAGRQLSAAQQLRAVVCMRPRPQLCTNAHLMLGLLLERVGLEPAAAAPSAAGWFAAAGRFSLPSSDPCRRLACSLVAASTAAARLAWSSLLGRLVRLRMPGSPCCCLGACSCSMT